jgi:RND family efflux transporter MFP subunit
MTLTRFSILGSLGLALVACAKRPEAASTSAGSPRPIVSVGEVERRPFLVGYRASGTVRGHSTATLTSKGLGQVRALHVRSGDRIKQGQLLIELEANDVRAGVARARAALALATASKLEADNAIAVAKANAGLAKTQHQRSQQLLKQGVISQREYDETEARTTSAAAQEQGALARAAAAESGIQEARAAVSEAEAQLGYTKLTAPFNGRVLERLVDPGTLASPGTPLLVLADDAALRVEAFVPESHAAGIKLGGTAQLELDGSAPAVGKISEIVANVDTASRSFLVKVDVPEGATELRPGTFARVIFPMGSEPRLVLPGAAVTHFGALERVFVLEHGQAQLRMVTTGERQDGFATVLSGLSEGERVVVAPPAGLRDRERVEVKQ